MMWSILNYRLWAAVVLGVALLGSHWKMYTLGGDRATNARTAEKLEEARDLAKLVEQARLRQEELQANARKVTNEYVNQKNARVADAARAADRLRDYQGALARLTAADRESATAGRVDEAVAAIASECAAALGTMDGAAKQYRSIAEALQGYTREVCLKQVTR